MRWGNLLIGDTFYDKLMPLHISFKSSFIKLVQQYKTDLFTLSAPMKLCFISFWYIRCRGQRKWEREYSHVLLSLWDTSFPYYYSINTLCREPVSPTLNEAFQWHALVLQQTLKNAERRVQVYLDRLLLNEPVPRALAKPMPTVVHDELLFSWWQSVSTIERYHTNAIITYLSR